MISYTFSFDFMRTVWWCPSCSIGYVWPFMELQLTALSALAPTQGTHKLIGAGLNRNYTGNPLMFAYQIQQNCSSQKPRSMVSFNFNSVSVFSAHPTND